MATVNGKQALLVGNGFGDILTLLYDGLGGFAPDRADLHAKPLAVGTLAGSGQQFAVVADQDEAHARIDCRGRRAIFSLEIDHLVLEPVSQ